MQCSTVARARPAAPAPLRLPRPCLTARNPAPAPVPQIEDELAAEAAGVQAEEEVPEWELYRQKERQERRHRFKKGGKKKAAEDGEEEVRGLGVGRRRAYVRGRGAARCAPQRGHAGRAAGSSGP